MASIIPWAYKSRSSGNVTKKRPSRSSIWQVAASVGAVTIGALTVVFAAPSAKALDARVLEALQAYLQNRSPDLSAEERREAAQVTAYQEIDDWPFQTRLTSHRLFAFQKGWNRQAFVVLALDRAFDVWPIRTKEDLNDLLKREGATIGSATEAQEVAQLFLQSVRASKFFYFGWPLGFNVVGSLDDIQFKSPMERAHLAAEINIQPPTMTTSEGQYRFVLYAWDKIGAGALWKCEVTANEKGIVAYSLHKLKADVGLWEPL